MILWPASAMLTGNGVAFVLRVPGTRARRLVDAPRLVDLRRDGRRLAALEARDQVARRAHLQPVEHRPRHLLPRARPERAPRRSTSGGGRRRRGSRSRSSSSSRAGSRSCWRLQLLRVALGFWVSFAGGHRRARARRPLDDGALASRADLGLPLLVDADHVARGARLPLLHDHRPEDGAPLAAGAARLRRLARAARVGADRADDDRVRGQGRAARRARDRVHRRCRCSRLVPFAARRRALALAAAAARGLRGARSSLGEPAGRSRPRVRAAAAGRAAADHDPAVARRPDAARPPHGRADRARPARGRAGAHERPRRGSGSARPRPGAADGGRAARRRHVPPPPDRRPGTGRCRRPRPPTQIARRRSDALAGDASHERRGSVGLDFRQGSFRFGAVERRPGDDGRRRLLARLQRRRLAWTCSSSTPTRAPTPTAGRRTAACRDRAVRERPRQVPQRQQRRTPTCRCRATAASRPTSTATAAPTSSSRRRAASTCSGTTATALHRGRALPARTAGTQASRSPT